jgi:hypothetical protein
LVFLQTLNGITFILLKDSVSIVKENQSYQEINDFLQNLPKNFNILEEQIDVSIQMDYFERSNKLKNELILDKELDINLEKLNDSEIDSSSKKDILIKLAKVENVKAFRAIEDFLKLSLDKDIKAWATLALQENRMLLESTFLDEKQVFISTGLGGKGEKLRYFIVGFLDKENIFTEMQKEVLKKEFEYSFSENDCELEKIRFDNQYALLTALIPIKSNIKDILSKAIDECRDLGMDLSEHFMVTNVKELDIFEIEDFIHSQINKIEGDERYE